MTRRRLLTRRASALLIVLFLVAVTAPLVCMLLETHTSAIRCTHNSIEGTTALYIAEAGVQDAVAELLADPSWRTGFTDKEFPQGLGHTYTVTLEDDGQGALTVVSIARTAKGHSRNVTVILNVF